MRGGRGFGLAGFGLAGCWALVPSCTEASSPPDDLSRACERAASCEEPGSAGRAEQTQACRERLSSEYDEAATYGCAGAYADWVSCLASAPDVCAEEGPGSCQLAQQAFRDCQGRAARDECVIIGNVGGAGGAGPAGCIISCALFSARCAAPATNGTATSCECDSGAHVGATFSIPSCSGTDEQPARAACQ